MSLTSVTSRPWAEKCLRNSASEIVGGKFLTKTLDDSMVTVLFFASSCLPLAKCEAQGYLAVIPFGCGCTKYRCIFLEVEEVSSGVFFAADCPSRNFKPHPTARYLIS